MCELERNTQSHYHVHVHYCTGSYLAAWRKACHCYFVPLPLCCLKATGPSPGGITSSGRAQLSFVR